MQRRALQVDKIPEGPRDLLDPAVLDQSDGIWLGVQHGLVGVDVLEAFEELLSAAGEQFHQVGIQTLGLLAVGVWTFSASFGILWTLNKLWGIRVEPETETAGLDVSEHGMWGYPEFYIPVPGGYGTETHGHLGLAHAARSAEPTAVGDVALEPT